MTRMQGADTRAFYSSLVIEHIVAQNKVSGFEAWHRSLMQTVRQYTGFIRSDCCPPLPCEDGVVKWYTIIHFDSPEHLNLWVKSKARKSLFEAGYKTFRAYRFKSFTTGLEGWFSRSSPGAEKSDLGPAAWKQILAVVFGLYPLVMIRLRLPNTLFSAWSLASSTLVMTTITSFILGYAVMPNVSKLLGFWLFPAYRNATLRTELLGLGLIVAGLLGMSAIFELI